MWRVLRLSVLGPLEVCLDGRRVPIGSGRQGALLAALLCRPGRVVSAADLVEAVWHRAYTPEAANNLCVYIHRVRRSLGDTSRIANRPPGYLLRVDPDELDASRFDRMATLGARKLASGDAAGASTLLGDALSLWRGEAFAGLDDTAMVRNEAVRLTERRLAALESRIEADLALGRATDLVAELAGLTRQHPFRERFHAQHLRALHRAGRRTEALAAYRRLRALTIAELGLEPSAELQKLHRTILADAAITVRNDRATAPPEWRQAPVSPAATAVERARQQMTRGEHAHALEAGRDALRAARTAGDAAAQRVAQEVLGTCLREQGRFAAAQDHLTSALGLAVADGDPHAEARSLQLLGVIERELSRLDSAARLLARVDAVCRSLGDPSSKACALLSTGELLLREGRSEARRWIDDGTALCKDIEIPFGIGYGTRLLGEVELATGHPRRALRLLHRAADLDRAAGTAFSLALVLRSLGSAYASQGYRAEARRSWSRAGQLFHSIGNSTARAQVIRQASTLA